MSPLGVPLDSTDFPLNKMKQEESPPEQDEADFPLQMESAGMKATVLPLTVEMMLGGGFACLSYGSLQGGGTEAVYDSPRNPKWQERLLQVLVHRQQWQANLEANLARKHLTFTTQVTGQSGSNRGVTGGLVVKKGGARNL